MDVEDGRVDWETEGPQSGPSSLKPCDPGRHVWIRHDDPVAGAWTSCLNCKVPWDEAEDVSGQFAETVARVAGEHERAGSITLDDFKAGKPGWVHEPDYMPSHSPTPGGRLLTVVEDLLEVVEQLVSVAASSFSMEVLIDGQVVGRASMPRGGSSDTQPTGQVTGPHPVGPEDPIAALADEASPSTLLGWEDRQTLARLLDHAATQLDDTVLGSRPPLHELAKTVDSCRAWARDLRAGEPDA